MSAAGERIVAVAETWIGTPYRHQGATRGIGCDCIGLIRGIWRELYGEEPEPVGPYAPDWAERGGEDRLLEAGIRLFGPALGGGQVPAGVEHDEVGLPEIGGEPLAGDQIVHHPRPR